jgi:hypothetical protein
MNDQQINSQDIIDVLQSQRDAAMNEIVRMGAIIKALERKLNELTKQHESQSGNQGVVAGVEGTTD